MSFIVNTILSAGERYQNAVGGRGRQNLRYIFLVFLFLAISAGFATKNRKFEFFEFGF
jgi:hypothetical protein